MVGFREAVRDLSPPVGADLFEREETYLLVVDLPGASAERTTVTTSNGRLEVSAERSPDVPPPDADVVEAERPDRLAFELPLPTDAGADEIRASLADGVLEVTIPRTTPTVSIPIEDE